MLAVFVGIAGFTAWAYPQQGPGEEKGGVYRVGRGVTPPRPLKRVEPEYTDEARDAKLEGVVVVYVVIGEDGRAHNIRVVRSLGKGLDEKAIEAVEQWEFEPGEKDGKPVKVGATIEINFKLN
jgi:TonB family protein